MERWKKFLAWLKNPPRIFLAVIYLITVAFCGGAIYLTALGELTFPLNALSYALYALAAIFLGYSVYTIVVAVPKIKKRIVGLLQRGRFTNRLLEQYGFRTIIFSVGSFAVSVAYVAFNGVIAILERSIWYGALAAYYLLLALMRGGALLFYRTKKSRAGANEKEGGGAVQIYKWCGIGLVVLPICLSFAILQMVRGVNSFEHAGMMIYVSAIYAFYKITMSVVNIFKARKTDDYIVRAIRCVNLADAMVSILALQTAMFKEFGGEGISSRMNAITGAVVCALTAALGIFIIIKANQKKHLQTEEEGGGTEQ